MATLIILAPPDRSAEPSSPLMWTLYQLAVGLALVSAGPFLLLRRGPHYLRTLRGRLGGHRGAVHRDALWLHAVSVGEVGVAATLAAALPPQLRLLVTTVTPTGQGRAQALFAERGSIAYLPFDLGFAVGRFFRRFAPRALVLIEGEYWPLVLRAARRHGLPVLLVNGRISDRSFRRLLACRRLLAPLFAGIDRFGMQSDEDRRRLLELGVPADRVVTTGNLKYETPAPLKLPALEADIGRLADGRPLLVAGSTMAGEDEQVAAAFRALGGGRRALLILAPRHPERFADVAARLEVDGLRVGRRSSLSAESAAPSGGSATDVLLLDSMGELASLYRLASAAFIGGTLVPTGGHNPLEAARHGVPVAAGPSMENFREMSDHFDRANAWQRVRDSGELAATWRRWLDHPASAQGVGERALALIRTHRGALERTLALFDGLVELD